MYGGEFNLTTTVQYLKYLITIFAIPTDQALYVYCLCSPFHTLPHRRKYILGTLLIGRQEIWTVHVNTILTHTWYIACITLSARGSEGTFQQGPEEEWMQENTRLQVA